MAAAATARSEAVTLQVKVDSLQSQVSHIGFFYLVYIHILACISNLVESIIFHVEAKEFISVLS